MTPKMNPTKMPFSISCPPVIPKREYPTKPGIHQVDQLEVLQFEHWQLSVATFEFGTTSCQSEQGPMKKLISQPIAVDDPCRERLAAAHIIITPVKISQAQGGALNTRKA